MSDFDDFLKHKYAYVAIGEFKPGCFSEARQLYEKAVSTYTKGFQGAYLLQEPGTDRGIAIILWDSIEDMDAHQDTIYAQTLAKIAHLFETPPVTTFYEVCSEIGLPQVLATAQATASAN
ncbi:antibiotic biosynthesis monooxygenase [Nodosilinea sp. P-1105]|uniref:putative quinol monooxygenase n=1 Tax=Nodosilinea sp. P-1105 TaxID=2546229 RepID=UPI00146CD811|nr:antibiotic biosynthesis monooxygenase [Nodosilinea sp. P-1105]NMF84956.1 antibiotic biosynthesis monooxygenase [Nodosilinea sp. P-1105]